jgi:hypothetical protein
VASPFAIAAIGNAILGLLQDSRPQGEFDGAKFELYQAANFASPMFEGLSLFLFRVASNGVRRNYPPRTLPDGRHLRSPLPIDLHYMLTPWAKTAERQHRILGWAMRALEDTPTLPASFLNHYALPERDAFLPEETITVVQEQITSQDMFSLWEFAKQNLQVSVTYAVRLVPLDSIAIPPGVDLVRTRNYALGETIEP